MKAIGKTDIGRLRKSNQDTFQIIETADNICAVVVCDGMGGANGGGYASLKCADILDACLSRKLFDPGESSGTMRALLINVICEANRVIYETSQRNENLCGMGTTVVCAVRTPGMLYMVHAGDSRAYRIRDGKAEQITHDHSVVQELLDIGRIAPESVKTHPDKHMITKAVGVSPEIEPEYRELQILPGDVFLACTDGLTGYLDENLICDIISNNGPEKAVSLLIETANEMGGSDNITAVIF